MGNESWEGKKYGGPIKIGRKEYPYYVGANYTGRKEKNDVVHPMWTNYTKFGLINL